MKTCTTVWFWAVILAGCSRRPEELSEIRPAPTPERSYRHPIHGFSIRVPGGWEIKDTENTAPLVLSLLSPKKVAEQFRESLSIRIEPNTGGLTAQQCFEESLGDRSKAKDFQLLTTAQETIGNEEAIGAIALVDLGDRMLQVLSYTVVSGKKVYTLTAIARREAFDEYKGIFRAIALSFDPE
jgi:hypothetical protein